MRDSKEVMTYLAVVMTLSIIPSLSYEQVPPEASSVNVSIVPGAALKTTDAFSPNPIVIQPGDSVIWTNDDSTPHTVASGTPPTPDGVFGGNDQILVTGKTQSHRFTEEGEFPYFCTLHPTMVGRVIVGGIDDGLTVETDSPSYEMGDTVKISGEVANVIQGFPVLLRIQSEDGTLVRVDQVGVDSNGFYNYNFQLGSLLFERDQTYSVIATYRGVNAETSFFIVGIRGNCQSFVPTILGTEGDDALNGTRGSDVIFGLDGNDVISGLWGDDIICGGPGEDVISGGDGDDRVSGGRGSDELFGDSGDDKILGGTGYDAMFGGDGNDSLLGGKGNDILDGGEGNDELSGQEGVDRLDGISDDDSSSASPHNIILDLSEIDFVYDLGDTVSIIGTIEGVDPAVDEVTIRIDGPESDDFTEDLNSNGDFFGMYEIPTTADDGIYSIEVEYDTYSVFTYFIIDEDNDDVTIETDDDFYLPGDTVWISGTVENPVLGEDQVEMTVVGPDGDVLAQANDEPADLDSSNDFEFELDLDNGALQGRYAVTVVYDSADEGYTIFEIKDEESYPITADVEESSYEPGQEVVVRGEVADVEQGEEVFIKIEDPDGQPIFDNSDDPTSTGSFQFEYTLEDDAEEGQYSVVISYLINELELPFSVESGNS
ncbi:MAG: plastocyanin/azurin family copper-binding protein [Nitrososphaera sp.]|nr:plastocyanin/azurin family copper-binding protein [Nitrososphaera sp.]